MLRFTQKINVGCSRQGAEKTLTAWKGDCDDIAIFGALCAEKIGYKNPEIMVISKRYKYSHVVTLIKKETSEGIKYGAFDRNFLLYPSFSSIKELFEKVNAPIFLNSLTYDDYYVLDLNKEYPGWRKSEVNLKPLLLKRRNSILRNAENLIRKRDYLLSEKMQINLSKEQRESIIREVIDVDFELFCSGKEIEKFKR